MNTLFLLLSMTLSGGEAKTEGFQKDWEAVLHSSKFKNEKLNAEVKIGKDKVVLRNRGVILSKKEYAKDGKGAVHVSFTWRWTKGDDGAYKENLAVVLRTDGVQRQQWSHEVLSGVLIRFNPTAGQVQLAQINGLNHDLIGSENVELKRDTDYNIRIVDDGQRIDIFVGDGKEPVLSKNAPTVMGQADRKICFYGREAVAGVEHEGIIRNLKIEVKK